MSAKKRSGFFSLFRRDALPEIQSNQDTFYYEQMATLVNGGGWSIDFLEKKSYFDEPLRALLETPNAYRPSLKHILHFIDKKHHDLVLNEFDKLESGESSTFELEMITYKNKTFWAICKCTPVFSGKMVSGIKGVVVNIDGRKNDQFSPDILMNYTESSNERLFKFANHISYSLKNQVNNLELTSQLFDEDALPVDQKELFNNYKEIAKSLGITVTQLNDVVSIQNKVKEKSALIDLEKTFESCKSDLQKLIQQKDGYVYSDFSEAPTIEYNLNFFRNIFCTLIENGVKNNKPGRKPEVKAYSLENNNKISIVIEDNGAGINLDEEDAFVYYTSDTGEFKTRDHSIDLFVIKSQIESMGGWLEVKSKEDYGTKFIIHL